MIRRWSTAFGAVWLAAASAQAPLAHVHPDDPDHHHASGFTHTHLGFAGHRGLSFEAHEDDEVTIWLDWAPVAQQQFATPASNATSAFLSEPEKVNVGAVREFEPRSHDPPSRRLAPPRAPPV